MNLRKTLLGAGPYLYQGKRRILDLTANNLTSNIGYASKTLIEKTIQNTRTRPQSQLRCIHHIHQQLPESLNTTVFTSSNEDAKSMAVFVASYLNLKSEILFAKDFLQDGPYLLKTLSSSFSRLETAALWLEPIMVRNGLYRFSPDFVEELVDVCRRNSILVICDETLTGMGRTGYLWAHQYYNLKPDIMIFGTNVASGYPMAGIVAPKQMLQRLKRPIDAFTSPDETTCKMCEGTFEAIQEESWKEFATIKGAFLKKKLSHLETPSLTTLQQCGLMLYLEFDEDIDTLKLQKGFLKSGLLVEVSDKNSCLIQPPLDIRYHELDDVVYRFEKATKLL